MQVLICGAAALPVAAAWVSLTHMTAASLQVRIVAFSLAAVPSYLIFALLLMTISGTVMRLARWRTPEDREMRIADAEWPLLEWARAMIATHVVRFAAGPLLRGTPVWSAYLRLCGARIGRRVFVNSLAVSDYNLLELGDDVVIGADAHVSGHTVESGVVRTGRVRLGNGVTIGVGAIIEIGAVIGDRAQVGALSFVPKHATLEADAVYVGIPAHPVAQRNAGEPRGAARRIPVTGVLTPAAVPQSRVSRGG